MKYAVGILSGFLLLHAALFAQSQDRSGRYRHHVPVPSAVPEYDYPVLRNGPALAQVAGSRDVFDAVQRTLAAGEADELARYFGKHIFLNIRSVESGYYSSNQAQFVVQNFFNAHRPQSFSFSTYGESAGSPYATGRGSINVKGNREYIQIYVSLTKEKDRWVISQFNIY
jgi:hypothetical protein